MDQKNLIPSISSNVSYVNEAFCVEDEGRTVNELFGAVPNKTDSRDSKSWTRGTKPLASSLLSQVHKKPRTSKQHIANPLRRFKTSRQRYNSLLQYFDTYFCAFRLNF
ncbi:hypothetical protein AVEN_238248-1 [Araneus ventricosus]|uniref:Uncharacterized protein n=1 Tax=Araneus ventricosus TaxID=182803 RepID=A0A4Y2N360_ARAVE|nr:hypothetical protein AVEN_238248-1 [Araneus ventricosus]